jgi:hypothetical protein
MVCKIVTILTGILSIVTSMGCVYSFGGSIPSDVTSVAIPLFDDNTSFPGVRDNLTNLVIDAFISNNMLRVVNESDADLLITGTILSIRQQAAIVTTGEEVDQFDVYVNVKVKCEHLASGKVWWEKTLRRFGTMSGGGTQADQEEAIDEAILQITDDILNNTLAYW